MIITAHSEVVTIGPHISAISNIDVASDPAVNVDASAKVPPGEYVRVGAQTPSKFMRA